MLYVGLYNTDCIPCKILSSLYFLFQAGKKGSCNQFVENKRVQISVAMKRDPPAALCNCFPKLSRPLIIYDAPIFAVSLPILTEQFYIGTAVCPELLTELCMQLGYELSYSK